MKKLVIAAVAGALVASSAVSAAVGVQAARRGAPVEDAEGAISTALGVGLFLAVGASVVAVIQSGANDEAPVSP